MPGKIKTIIQLLGGGILILGTLGYVASQFVSINSKLHQMVSSDIPKLTTTLEKNSEKSDNIKVTMDGITNRINSFVDQTESIKKIESDVGLLIKRIYDEVISEINQLEKESEQNLNEVKNLTQKVDNLSLQYVKFLKLSDDKITVSVPPKWIDELPKRNGTLYSIGVSPSATKLTKAQHDAEEQARSHLSTLFERKTIKAVGRIIEAAGKAPPKNVEDLSAQFREQLTKAINELLVDSQIESYWIDPAGYVYALVSFPLEQGIEGSKFGMLIETLKLMHKSITGVFMQDFERQLKVELLK